MSEPQFSTVDPMVPPTDTIPIILPAPRSLDTFIEIWYAIFLWSFFSSILVHGGASIYSFHRLKGHRRARFYPVIILVAGVITPVCVSLITSAAIAGVYKAAQFKMEPLYALVFGVGQTLVNLVLAYTRILATL